MKLNDIKFLPKANAFADVYAKATGMPFVGEMMVAAAGNGSEPAPTEFTITSMTIHDNGGGAFSVEATVINPNEEWVELDCIILGVSEYDCWFTANLSIDPEDPTHYTGYDNDDIDFEQMPECGFSGRYWADIFDGNGSKQADRNGMYNFPC